MPKSKYRGSEVMAGTWGEMWCNNEYIAEIIGFSATVEGEFADVNKARQLAKDKKLMGIEGTGEFKLNKVSSKFSKMTSDNFKEGKPTVVKLISNLDDPDARGNERIVIYDALLESATLADWESKSLGEETISFSFTDWDIEDYVL